MRRRALDELEATLEHRRREDAAPRLRDQIERLESLRLKFEDVRSEGRTLAIAYTKPIVIETAPACFEVRCMEARCNGRHDLSTPVLLALRQAKTVFEGQSSCNGMIGDVACDHTLAYAGEATYSR
ncbi:MAG: hypothetical protein ACHQ53_07820 [Polyangiales bacterium]